MGVISQFGEVTIINGRMLFGESEVCLSIEREEAHCTVVVGKDKGIGKASEVVETMFACVEEDSSGKRDYEAKHPHSHFLFREDVESHKDVEKNGNKKGAALLELEDKDSVVVCDGVRKMHQMHHKRVDKTLLVARIVDPSEMRDEVGKW
ncbi:hypothetical protein SK128_002717 [Halocaridina rubra]|uniref:Uncharacterized protein n=1 Tax=Halocaridina rubra TaxID=373956 RepID=A0AAN8WT54_HALRR